METIFTLGDTDDSTTKINMDELYEHKQKKDLDTLSIYNRILSRIHNKIKIISRKHNNDQVCWYIVPEMIIGINKYDNGECIAYLITKLKENGFRILYTHPNMLFISWKHWVPSYVRQEIKKKTGYIVDGYGNQINDNNNDANSKTNLNNLLFNNNDNRNVSENLKLNNTNTLTNTLTNTNTKGSKDYKMINSYKPSGNLIYNQDLLKKIENKSINK